MRPVLVFAFVALGPVVVAGCQKKPDPPPPQPTYTVGSVNIALPPGVSIPYPEGQPDAPTVNQTKCNFVVDRQIKFMTEANPTARTALAQAKPQIMAECMTKWTQQQYDCMMAAKTLAEIIACKQYERP